MKNAALLAACVTGLAVTTPSAIAQSADALDPILACRAIADDAERLACFDAAANALGSAEEAGQIVVVRRAQIDQVERESFGFSVPGMSALAEAMSGMFASQPSETPPRHAAMATAPSADAEPAGQTVARADQTAAAQARTAEPSDAETRAEEVTGVAVRERNDSGEARVVVMAIERYHEFDYQRGRFYMQNGQVWEQTETKRMRMPRNGEAFAHIRRLSLGGYVLSVNGRGARTDIRRIR